MATEISVAGFKTALGECYDAIASEDYASAWKWMALAEVQLTGLTSSGSIDGAVVVRFGKSLANVRTALEAAEGRVTGPWEIHSRLVP